MLLVFSYWLTSRRYLHQRFVIVLFADYSLAFLFLYTHFVVDNFLPCIFLASQIAQIGVGKVFDCLLCPMRTRVVDIAKVVG